MTKFIAITDNSVWLVEQAASGGLFIEDRATFGSPFIEDGRRFAGPVCAGDLKAGSRLTFKNVFEDTFGRTGQPVHTGVINRVVAHADKPMKVVPEGFIDITPSWEAIAPVRPELAREAGKHADRLVSLMDLGRINTDDIRRADIRTEERMS